MIRVENHLIVPFGRLSCESHRIRLVGSSTQEMLFESDSPCLYVNRSNITGFTLDQCSGMFSLDNLSDPADETLDYLHSLCDLLRGNCELHSSYQHLFLTLYFDQVWEEHCASGKPLGRCLMPLPQTHFYLTDFSDLLEGKCQQKCVRVDFAFWTGQRFLAIQITEPTDDDRIRDERLLRFWGIDFIRMPEEEISDKAVRNFVQVQPDI
jgi:hypothetical protein